MTLVALVEMPIAAIQIKDFTYEYEYYIGTIIIMHILCSLTLRADMSFPSHIQMFLLALYYRQSKKYIKGGRHCIGAVLGQSNSIWVQRISFCISSNPEH